MKIGDSVKSTKRSDYGKIVKIWWDGTIRVEWDSGHHTLCNMADIVVVKWKKNKKTIVKLKSQ